MCAMLIEGLKLLVVGMSTVFAFLGLLVVAMHASAAYFRQFGDAMPAVAGAARVPDANDIEIAVVLAAIAVHREAHS